MINSLPPGFIMFIGAFLIPFLPKLGRQIYMIFLVLLSAFFLFNGFGTHLTINVLDYNFIINHSDNLSLPFAIVFHIAAFITIIYGAHKDDWKENVAVISYAGAAIAALHAGDLFTLFFWWEATAFTSVFLVLGGNTTRAYRAAFRYIVIQVGSGMFLLAGAVLFLYSNGNALLGQMSIDDTSGLLIFLAFGIKAAFPFLNGWLQDTYPEASEVGTVALSSFTTKLAIYALARSFAGTDILIYIGALMTFFPIFFAVIENDLRRVLAYSLNNQLGFMVVAVGIGTELAINGAAAHAFAHIIYKGLLFMSMGAVLYRAGTTKASELGGLYKYMPFTTIFCIIGAMSISAFPLFSGFVAKSLIMSSLGGMGMVLIYFILFFASAGVLEHSGIKIPYFAFFAHERKNKVKEAPINMLIAMGIAAFLCIAIGVFPKYLYQILPYAVEYQPYTLDHVISQLQLLVFAIIAFLFLVKFKLYPSEIRSTVLNSDWFYRKMLPGIGKPLFKKIGLLTDSLYKNLGLSFKQVLSKSYKFSNLSYIKVTTPSFAGTILISILFIMLVIVLV